MSVNNLQKNKDSYSEYVSYFESIAVNNNAIGHSLSHNAFQRYDLINMFGNKMNNLQSPFLGLEDPSIRLVNNENQNILNQYFGAFTIAEEVEEDNEAAIQAAFDTSLSTIRDILAKILSDRRNRKIFDFDFDSVQINKVREIFRNYYGWRVQFAFGAQFDLTFDQSKWTNEVDAIALPPFATVTDGNSTIELGVGESYSCAMQADGTVVLKDSNGIIIESQTVSPNQNLELIAPDVTEQINGTTYDQSPSGTVNNLLVINQENDPVGNIANPCVVSNSLIRNSNDTLVYSLPPEQPLTFDDTPIKVNGALVINAPSGVEKDLVIRHETQGLAAITIISEEVVLADIIVDPKTINIAFGFEIGDDFVERTMTSIDEGTYTNLVSNGGLTSIVYKIDGLVVNLPFTIAASNVFRIEFDAAITIDEIQIEGTYS